MEYSICIQPQGYSAKIDKEFCQESERESLKYLSLYFLVHTHILQQEVQVWYNDTQVQLENSEDFVC